MKTKTILEAYEGVLKKRHMGFHHSRRQRDKFRSVLLFRIEEGDRAKTILKEIAEVYKHEDWYSEYGFRTQKIIEKHTDWLEELIKI